MFFKKLCGVIALFQFSLIFLCKLEILDKPVEITISEAIFNLSKSINAKYLINKASFKKSLNCWS